MWNKLWDLMKSMYSSCPFLTGIVLGVVGCAVVILLFRLYFRWVGSSKVSALSYTVDNGEITIRKAAVASLIFSLEKDFPELVMAGVDLYRKRELLFLRVVVDYRQGKRPFPEAVALFQKTVLEKLKGILGVEDIKKVEVRMRETIAESERSRG